MTNRSPVSSVQNVWFDSEQVDAQDLSLEQNYNTQIQSSIINNHVGTGILSESLSPRILFDSSLVDFTLDGVVINTTTVPSLVQPSDNNYGNQLEIILSDSQVAGRRGVKVAVIGLDFQQNLQYETFTFKVNESQVTKKHYTAILQILVNDFSGPIETSFNLGGKIVIQEVSPYTVSRDALVISQNTQPNIFFRDFFTIGYANLDQLLAAGLPTYDSSALNITPNELGSQTLAADDVTTQIGQKFLAKTNNIQKVTLLLSATNPDVSPDDYQWTGELVFSIYPLQNSLTCPTDVPPQNLLGYSPSPIPIAQISVTQASLAEKGIKLNSVPQPVDFEVSNTSAGTGNLITPGSYYAFTLKRSGANGTGNLTIPTGTKTLSDSALTVFNGSTWSDLPDQDLWFEIYSDSAKVSDGQAYESGIGILLPKVIKDPATGSTIDYCLDNLSFKGSDTFTGILFGINEKTDPVQDLRTGNPVFSRQTIKADVKLLSTLELNSLESTTDPLKLGSIVDSNKKTYETIGNTFEAHLNSFTLVNDSIFIKIIDDPSNPYYDAANLELVTKILNGELVDCVVYPDFIDSPSISYRVAKAEIQSMLYGDLNNDGVVDQADVELFNSYLDFNFKSIPPNNSVISHPTVSTTTFTNGYQTYKSPFINDSGLTFEVVDPNTNSNLIVGADGVITADPNNPRLAIFSTFVNLDSVALGGTNLVIESSSYQANNGGFQIVGYDGYNVNDGYVLTMSKIYLDNDSIGQILRADIDDNYQLDADDGYIIESFSNKSIWTNPVIDGYINKIGSRFNVVKLTLEQYELGGIVTDRTDDYYTSLLTRNADVHTVYDIFEQDVNIQNRSTSPTLFFLRQFGWHEYLIGINSKNKLVPTIFNDSAEAALNSCSIQSQVNDTYGEMPSFDPGRVDAFSPSNMIINYGGELRRPDGNFYKVDFEVGVIVLEIPTNLDGYKSIDVFNDFVADYDKGGGIGYTGVTRLGYPAMKFSDCSTVKPDALINSQVRFAVSIQSYSPNLDGIVDGYSGTVVDGKLGVGMSFSTGVLTINFNNLYQDEISSTSVTRVQIEVYLKKAGFNNRTLYVSSEEVFNISNIPLV